MDYQLLKEVINLLEEFGNDDTVKSGHRTDIDGLKEWIAHKFMPVSPDQEPSWEGKENGRSPESVINTLVVHMNRYARTYSKAAIHNSNFSTQEEFIYLINLKAFGRMTKMELIKKNVQDKPTGMQIIGRLLKQGWIKQTDSESDRRSKILEITPEGQDALEAQMDHIRQATNIVTGKLNHKEKMDLIRLLTKLDHFHKPIFSANIAQEHLLEWVNKEYLSIKN